MSNDLQKVMTLIVGEMTKLAELGQRLPEVNTKFFEIYTGLSIALVKIWEVSNGHKPGHAMECGIKPQEILAWARDNMKQARVTRQ